MALRELSARKEFGIAQFDDPISWSVRCCVSDRSYCLMFSPFAVALCRSGQEDAEAVNCQWNQDRGISFASSSQICQLHPTFHLLSARLSSKPDNLALSKHEM